MATFYFMIGIPGSGKSTYAASLGCRVVCPDAIRETYGTNDEQSFVIARHEIRTALQRWENVVLDATNTIRIWRAERIAIGKPYADRVVCIFMDTPLEVCIARHLERMKRGIRATLLVEVIKRMARQLADNPPELSEGFDEIRRITLSE